MSQQKFPLVRQIDVSDFDEIAGLLVQGFPYRTKTYYIDSLRALRDHETPKGYPRFGLMIESDGRARGVLLLIYSTIGSSERSCVRCNVSNWYVEPQFRFAASWLVSVAFRRHLAATFINTTPAPHTWPIIEAQGFRRFTSGSFIAFSAVSLNYGLAKITEFRDPKAFKERLPPHELRLLSDHYDYGCITLACEIRYRTYAFVFKRRWIKSYLPAAQLIYCSDEQALVQARGPIGRYLLMRGMPFLLIGSQGPLPLPGRYFDNVRPMYYRGDEKPRTYGDLAYSELALFDDI
jgi:hypothetical protein